MENISTDRHLIVGDCVSLQVFICYFWWVQYYLRCPYFVCTSREGMLYMHSHYEAKLARWGRSGSHIHYYTLRCSWGVVYSNATSAVQRNIGPKLSLLSGYV